MPANQTTYQCDQCGKTVKRPANDPPPQCCGQAMKKAG